MTYLWGVPQSEVAKTWALVAYLITDGLSHSDRLSLDDIVEGVEDGSQQMWVAWVGDQVKAVGITEIYETSLRRVCSVVFATGELEVLASHINEIEDWARASKCDRIEMLGRRWSGVLPGFKETHVLTEKEL